MGIFPHHIWVKDSESNTVSEMFQKWYGKLCSAVRHQCAPVQTHCDIKFSQHAFTAWGMLVRWLTLHSKMSAGLIASLFWMEFLYSAMVGLVCSSFYTGAVRIFWFKAAAILQHHWTFLCLSAAFFGCYSPQLNCFASRFHLLHVQLQKAAVFSKLAQTRWSIYSQAWSFVRQCCGLAAIALN